MQELEEYFVYTDGMCVQVTPYEQVAIDTQTYMRSQGYDSYILMGTKTTKTTKEKENESTKI